jgi:3-dehydroquinate synthase
MHEQIVSESPLVIIGHGLQEIVQSTIQDMQPEQILVVVDENTHKHCLPLFPKFSNYNLLVCPSGEGNKNIIQAQQIWNELLHIGADRSSLVIALGGGVLCDTVAFAATTYMRGIRFVLMPTTLLAIVDASVGGKTGINYSGFKNIIGSFREADAVFADLDFLQTLPKREFVSGYAEVVKHALLQGDLSWEALNSQSPQSLSIDDLANSIRYKRSITSADFNEKGNREILNLGHTTAHALEAVFLKNEAVLLHGEAVAAGLWIESIISEMHFPESTQAWISQLRALIKAVFPKVEFPMSSLDDIVNAMRNDKKNKNSETRFSLLRYPGHAEIGCTASSEQLKSALKEYLENA